jgi:hypothetical protein
MCRTSIDKVSQGLIIAENERCAVVVSSLELVPKPIELGLGKQAKENLAWS